MSDARDPNQVDAASLKWLEQLKKDPGFVGEMAVAEISSRLAHQPSGTYILVNGPRPNTLGIHIVNDNNEIMRTLVATDVYEKYKTSTDMKTLYKQLVEKSPNKPPPLEVKPYKKHPPISKERGSERFAFFYNGLRSELNLYDLALTDEDMPDLCEFLEANPQIKTLELSRNNISSKGATLLANNTTLTSLSLQDNLISPEDRKVFSENKTIASLTLYHSARQDIIPYLKALGLKGDMSGMCYGISNITADGMLSGTLNEIITYAENLRRSGITPAQFAEAVDITKETNALIARAKTEVKNEMEQGMPQKYDSRGAFERALTSEQKAIYEKKYQEKARNTISQLGEPKKTLLHIESAALFEGKYTNFQFAAHLHNVEIYQNAYLYHHLIEGSEKVLHQDAVKATPLLASPELKAKGGRVEVAIFNGIYDKSELTAYFKALRENIVEKFPYPIALNLLNANHAITIGYDAELNRWTFANSNDPLTYISDEALLAESLLKGFSQKERVAFRASLSITSDPEETHDVEKQAQHIKNFKDTHLKNLLTDKAWQAIHTVSQEKVLQQGNHLATWLQMAILANDHKTVNELLKMGVNPNQHSYLMLAYKRGYNEIVQTLLKHQQLDFGKHLSTDNQLLFDTALEKNDIPFIKELLKIKQFNNYFRVSCREAVMHEKVAALETLIAAGNLNEGFPNNETPLFWAATLGKLEMVKLLIENGANPNLSLYPNLPIYKHKITDHVNSANVLAYLQNVAIPLQSIRDEIEELKKAPVRFGAAYEDALNALLKEAQTIKINEENVNQLRQQLVNLKELNNYVKQLNTTFAKTPKNLQGALNKKINKAYEDFSLTMSEPITNLRKNAKEIISQYRDRAENYRFFGFFKAFQTNRLVKNIEKTLIKEEEINAKSKNKPNLSGKSIRRG